MGSWSFDIIRLGAVAHGGGMETIMSTSEEMLEAAKYIRDINNILYPTQLAHREIHLTQPEEPETTGRLINKKSVIRIAPNLEILTRQPCEFCHGAGEVEREDFNGLCPECEGRKYVIQWMTVSEVMHGNS